MTVYPIADAHIGMMAWGKETGEDYNTKIAVARLQSWLGACIAASPPSETAIILDVGDLTHADARAYNKLHFGVPILRAENEAFRLSYDRVMKHLEYETKLEAIKAMDLPVTRLMLVKQMTAYMDAVSQHLTPQGVRLTHPDDLK